MMIMKDIATLYEIWGFIEVSHIVKAQLHLDDEDVEHRNRMEMNGIFSWELGKGEHSRILFRKDAWSWQNWYITQRTLTRKTTMWA